MFVYVRAFALAPDYD